MSNIQRYIDAQQIQFNAALHEIQTGKKISHWMWYIFPQIHSLGYSYYAQLYALQSIQECIDYLNDAYLFENMYRICNELLKQTTDNPIEIFGDIDAMKLQSSMTIFHYVWEKKQKLLKKNQPDIFMQVLNKYYHGQLDTKTLDIIQNDPDCVS